MGTSDLVIRMVRENPATTTAAIVAATGVSRQRVHQILKAAGLRAAKSPAVRSFRPAQPRVIPSGGIGAVSASACGMIGEMLCACDLLARGWHVFSPVVRHSLVDLIVVSPDGSDVRRIEVRSGAKRGEALIFTKKPYDVCDHYAVIVEGEPVNYIPAIETHQKRRTVNP